MKNLKSLLTAVLAFGCLSVSAQFTNSGGGVSSNANSEGWSSVYFQYNPSTLVIDYSGAKDRSFTGLMLGYSKAFSISSSLPLYVEAGGALEYSFYSDEVGGVDEKVNVLAIKVPVNLVYNYEIPNSSVALAPYLGVSLRGIILAKDKEEWNGGDKTYDLFDKDDVGKDGQWKRIQFGAQLGCNVKFNNKFFLGLGYGTDFTEICKKEKMHEFIISAGLIF